MVVATVLVAACAAVLGLLAQRESGRRREVLRQVADRHGGRVDAASWGGARLEVTIDGVSIQVEMWSTKHAEATEWHAQLPAPGTVGFDFFREGIAGAIGKALGGQDVVLGTDAAFDREYVVRTRDAAALRRVLSPATTLRTLRAAYPEGLHVGCDGRRLDLRWPRIARSTDPVDTGIDLVMAIARADVFGLAALRALAGARLHTGDSELPYAVIDGPGDIVIGPAWIDDQLVTRARAATARAPKTTGSLPGCRIEQVADAVTITWSAIETDPAILGEAIALLQQLARPPSQGVFR